MKINNCVYLRITGGLGNQLFQYSYALARARDQSRLLFVNTYYQNHFINPLARNSAKREFVLDKMGILANDVTVINQKEKIILDKFLKVHAFRHRLLRSTAKFLFSVEFLDDYFCCAKDFRYSRKTVNEIKSIYRERNQNGAGNCAECLVHVRGGDLLNQPHNIKCGVKYYKNAFIEMSKHTVKKYKVITEDVEYAKTILPKDKRWEIEYQIPDNEINDFKSLSNAKYIISANSTFSWWASILSDCNLFVSPPYFYNDGDKPGIQENEIIINH